MAHLVARLLASAAVLWLLGVATVAAANAAIATPDERFATYAQAFAAHHMAAGSDLLPTVDVADTESARVWRAVLPLSLAALLLAVFVGIELRKRKQLAPASRLRRARSRHVPTGRTPTGGTAIVEAIPTHRSYSTGDLEVVESSLANVIVPSSNERECPTCGRTFESVLALCPYDGDELAPRGTVRRDTRQPTDEVDTSSSHMVCPQCNTRLELGHRFCPHDGVALIRRSADAPTHDDLLVCPACGALADGDAAFCTHDHTRLISRREGDEAHLSHAPVLICTSCLTEYASETQQCAECATPLQLLHGRTTSGQALPSDVVMSRICPECGGRYNHAVRHCTADGTELAAVN